MIMNKIKCLIICISIGLLSANAIAQHNENEKSDHHDEKSHDVNKHHIALFGGTTTILTHEVNLLTFGLDYEYRLPYVHNKFGVGFNAEYLVGDNSHILLGIPLFYHPVAGLKFEAAPMLAIVREDAEGDHGTHETAETTTKNEFAFRIGTAYDFHINQFSISPTVNFDFVGETTALAYGIAFGIGF